MKCLVHVVLALLLTQGALVAEEAVAEAEKSESGVEFLGRNVRLDFRMVPEEPDDEPLFIITAVSEFEAGASFENDGGSFSFHIDGQIEVAEDGLLLVVYEAELNMDSMEGGGKTRARSGVLLKPGQELGVARIGDKTLMIKASYLTD
jgi:hypothetical protein